MKDTRHRATVRIKLEGFELTGIGQFIDEYEAMRGVRLTRPQAARVMIRSYLDLGIKVAA